MPAFLANMAAQQPTSPSPAVTWRTSPLFSKQQQLEGPSALLADTVDVEDYVDSSAQEDEEEKYDEEVDDEQFFTAADRSRASSASQTINQCSETSSPSDSGGNSCSSVSHRLSIAAAQLASLQVVDTATATTTAENVDNNIPYKRNGQLQQQTMGLQANKTEPVLPFGLTLQPPPPSSSFRMEMFRPAASKAAISAGAMQSISATATNDETNTHQQQQEEVSSKPVATVMFKSLQPPQQQEQQQQQQGDEVLTVRFGVAQARGDSKYNSSSSPDIQPPKITFKASSSLPAGSATHDKDAVSTIPTATKVVNMEEEASKDTSVKVLDTKTPLIAVPTVLKTVPATKNQQTPSSMSGKTLSPDSQRVRLEMKKNAQALADLAVRRENDTTAMVLKAVESQSPHQQSSSLGNSPLTNMGSPSCTKSRMKAAESPTTLTSPPTLAGAAAGGDSSPVIVPATIRLGRTYPATADDNDDLKRSGSSTITVSSDNNRKSDAEYLRMATDLAEHQAAEIEGLKRDIERERARAKGAERKASHLTKEIYALEVEVHQLRAENEALKEEVDMGGDVFVELLALRRQLGEEGEEGMGKMMGKKGGEVGRERGEERKMRGGESGGYVVQVGGGEVTGAGGKEVDSPSSRFRPLYAGSTDWDGKERKVVWGG